jgi:hypothetical protein
VRRLSPRSLKKLLFALAALAALYLVAANLFLTTAIGPWAINRNPRRLRVTWARAWSLYPGDVRVRGLAIEGHTGRVDWSVGVDSGRGWIDMPALALRRFRVIGFAGEGVRSTTARRPEDIGTERRGTPRRFPWRVEMPGITLTGVREIGYDRFRLRGDGTAHGGFSLRVGGDFTLAPTTLRMPGALLLLGDETVARGLDVRTEAAIAPFTPRRHPGVAGFDFVSGTLRARGSLLTAPAAGDLSIDLRLDHGRLTPGSLATLRAGSPLAALLAVETNEAGPLLVLRADARGLAVGRLAAEALHLEAVTAETRVSRLLARAREVRHTGSLPAGVLNAAWSAAGLRLASVTPRSSWQLTAERGTGWIDLPALLRREVLLAGVRGNGIAAHLERTEEQPGPAPLGRAWAVRLTDARLTGIREIAVDDLRLTGGLEAAGGLALDPDGTLALQPLALRLSGGRVRRGAATLAHGLSLRADAALGPWSPRTHSGIAALDSLTGTVAARGTLDDLPFLSLDGRRRSGALALDLRLDRGRLAPGSRMSVSGGKSLRITGAVVAQHSERPIPPRLQLAAEARDFRLGGGSGYPPVLRARSAVLRTSSPELGLRHLLSTAEELSQGGSPTAAALTGDLETRGLVVHGLGEQVVWRLTVDRGSARIDLAALLRRRAALHGMRLDGAAARIDPAQGPPPVVPPGKRWAFELDDARIDDLRALSFGTDRLRGTGHLEGALSFDRARVLTIRRALLTVPQGRLESGGAPVARRVAVRAEVRVAPFEPGKVRGGALLRLVSGAFSVQGQVSSLGFLQRYLQKAQWLQIDGQGRLDADVHLGAGRLLAGSRIEVRGGRVSATFLDSVARGEATVTGAIGADAGKPAATLGVDFSSFQIAPREDASSPSSAYIQGAGLRLGVVSTDLDLATPVSDLRATIDLPDGRVPDLAVYNAYLPPDTGVAIVSGSGRLRLHLALDAATQTGGGELLLTSGETRVLFQDVELAGNLMLSARLTSPDLRARRFQIGGTRLDLDRVTYREVDDAPGAERPGWWAHLRLTEGSMVWGRPLSLRGTALVEMKDSGLLLSVFARRKNFLRWFHRLLSIEGVHAQGTITCGDGVIEIAPLRVTGGRFDLRSRLRFSRDSKQGDLFVRWGKLATGIELRDGKRTFKLRHPEQWFESGREEP